MLLYNYREGVRQMRNLYKRETSKDYTAWDLNCRWIIPHKKGHNRLERIFKRKNRRKIKKMLDKYSD
jgi:glycine cleavage system aminomethyltransferase T